LWYEKRGPTFDGFVWAGQKKDKRKGFSWLPTVRGGWPLSGSFEVGLEYVEKKRKPPVTERGPLTQKGWATFSNGEGRKKVIKACGAGTGEKFGTRPPLCGNSGSQNMGCTVETPG